MDAGNVLGEQLERAQRRIIAFIRNCKVSFHFRPWATHSTPRIVEAHPSGFLTTVSHWRDNNFVLTQGKSMHWQETIAI